MSTRSLNVAASGMSAQDKNVSNMANNIANSNTTGFKGGFMAFADLMYQDDKRSGGPVIDGTTTMVPSGIQFGSGVAVNAIVKDFRQGDPLNTGDQLHVAVSGTGFFVIDLPDGTKSYTRDGTFMLDPSSGQIVTTLGYQLDQQIAIPPNYKRIVIKSDGSVWVDIPGQTALQNVGHIQLARFFNNGGLLAIGDNLFQETDASGQPVLGNPQDDNYGKLMQGWLEASNVDPIMEITNLIKAQRNYEMNSKVIQTADQMLKNVTDSKA